MSPVKLQALVCLIRNKCTIASLESIMVQLSGENPPRHIHRLTGTINFIALIHHCQQLSLAKYSLESFSFTRFRSITFVRILLTKLTSLVMQ